MNSYIDCKLNKGKITTWVRSEDGIQTVQYPLEDYLYLFTPANNQDVEADYHSLNGTKMRKVRFQNPKTMDEFARNHSATHESDVRPVYKCLIDNFSKADPSSPFHFLPFDIEVDFDLEDGRGYPSIFDPFGEINSISVFDYSRMTYVMFIPDHLRGKIDIRPGDGLPLDIFWTASERDMLMLFASYLSDIDVISAWNGDGFDIPYIMERALLHFGDDATTMFCRDGIPARKREYTDSFKQDIWTWEFAGRVHVDMQQLYKKFIPGEKPTTKLSAIAEIENLGIEKMEYDGDLGTLYRENPQKFFAYSLRDSELLKAMEDKKQLVKMAMLYARDTCVLPTDATGSVKPIEHGFIKFCREKDNIVLPDRGEKKESQEFPGAIVYDTIPGRHGYVFTVDLAALYPSCMIMLGLSPETVAFQCKGTYDDYVAVMSRSEEPVEVVLEDTAESVTLPGWEVHDLIKEEGFTLSAYGTAFKGHLGLLAEYVKSGFDRRVAEKKIMADAYKAGDKAKGDLYNLFQAVTKIRNNSIYGCVGNEFFRLYDIRIAASITLTGQMISKQQAVVANQILNEITA